MPPRLYASGAKLSSTPRSPIIVSIVVEKAAPTLALEREIMNAGSSLRMKMRIPTFSLRQTTKV